ncbi:hypothetical protein [Neorhizobium sp. DAR64860/K0K1]|uniref:hypothetical protein n=1 Tax=Neorhizobium sp. DAR64860/K0K1 TaxID=3421955 RepID=UPI003D2C0977
MKESDKKFAVDFSSVLMGPNGKTMLDTKFDDDGKPQGQEPLTVGSLCYLVLTRPMEDDQMSAQQAVRYFLLASTAAKGGQQELTVSDKSLLLSRIDKFPLGMMAKAALLAVIDPLEYDKAARVV